MLVLTLGENSKPLLGWTDRGRAAHKMAPLISFMTNTLTPPCFLVTHVS